VCHQRGEVFGGGRERQGARPAHATAGHIEEHVALVVLDALDLDALPGQQRVEALVDFAVHRFLAGEVKQRLLVRRVAQLVLVVANACNEKTLPFREKRGHGVEEAAAKGVAPEPVAGNGVIQAEVEVISHHHRCVGVQEIGGEGGHSGHGFSVGTRRRAVKGGGPHEAGSTAASCTRRGPRFTAA